MSHILEITRDSSLRSPQWKTNRMKSAHTGLNNYEIDALRLTTGPFASPFTRSLAPLTHSLAPHCSLRSRAPLRSFAHSLAHSLIPELMGKRFFSMNKTCRFHTFSAHCAMGGSHIHIAMISPQPRKRKFLMKLPFMQNDCLTWFPIDNL